MIYSATEVNLVSLVSYTRETREILSERTTEVVSHLAKKVHFGVSQLEGVVGISLYNKYLGLNVNLDP